MSKKDNVAVIHRSKEEVERLVDSIKYTKFYKKDESYKRYLEFSKKFDENAGYVSRKEFDEMFKA